MTLQPLLASSPIIITHALAAIAAVILGATQLISPKGTPLHKVLGWAWVSLMAITALSSFAIFEIRLFGPFSPIHLLSMLSLATLAFAMIKIRQGDVRAHKRALTWLFFGGLVLAGAFTLMPGRIMHAVVFGV